MAYESDYRFRGVSLSDGGPTLRATLDYDAASGCYAGAAATRVELARGDRYAQLFGLGGCVVPAGFGHQLDIGATYSHFTGNASYDFAEGYVGWLAERWNTRLHFAPNYFGRHASVIYLEFDAHSLMTNELRVFWHAGAVARLSGSAGNGAGRFRADVRLGAGWAFRDLDLQLAWMAASCGGPYPAVSGSRRSAFVASASYSF